MAGSKIRNKHKQQRHTQNHVANSGTQLAKVLSPLNILLSLSPLPRLVQAHTSAPLLAMNGAPHDNTTPRPLTMSELWASWDEPSEEESRLVNQGSAEEISEAMGKVSVGAGAADG